MEKDDLLNLKREIDLARNEVSELKGRRSGLIQDLEKNWGCSSLEEAMDKIEQLDKKLSKAQKELEDGMEELREYLKDDN
jgi:predicted transcriptional regulator